MTWMLLIVCRLIVIIGAILTAMSNATLKLFGSQIRRFRTALGLSQERLAELAGLHRTYIGSIERGERNVSLANMAVLANALGISLSTLFDNSCCEIACEAPGSTSQGINHHSALHGHLMECTNLRDFGLNAMIIREAIQFTHQVLDRIDNTLLELDGHRLATMIELANLSAIVGNLFRTGVSNASDGLFKANRPHTYPDLVAISEDAVDIEIKVALESNNPKGHLVKTGPHITVRYVLADEAGTYHRGTENRGDVVWIWEVRVGMLLENHFSFSNTEGDSGKTAVINSEGMSSLIPVFLDLDKCPYSPRGYVFKRFEELSQSAELNNGHHR